MQTSPIYKKLMVCVFALLIFNLPKAQPPAVQWKKCYGGIGEEAAQAVRPTFDGGYIVAGIASYNDGDVTDDHSSGNPDIWIVKLSATGAIQWKKCYGGGGVEHCNSIQQTVDSGYIICGSTTSTDGDVTGFEPVPNNPYWGAYWILKISKTGALQWQKTMQGTGFDFSEANSVIQTRDSGYIVAGYDYYGTSGAFASGSIVKLSPAGTIQWQSNGNYDNDIQQTNDGGYIVAGTVGGYFYSLRKIDSTGLLQWQKFYGSMDGSGHFAKSVLQTRDGGYIAVGYADVADTTIHDNHGLTDVWLVRTDSLGNLQWAKSYGGRRRDNGNTIQPTFDGGYIIAATTDSWDGDVQNVNPALIDTFGAQDHTNIWMIKIDSLGNIGWQKTMGGNNVDLTGSMQQTADSGYIMAGAVVSNINASNVDINNTGFHWNSGCPNCTGHDFFVVKFAKEPASTVPVVLTGFTGMLVNKNAQLSWTTETALNNKYFEVQRSADGLHFITIGTVNGNGTNSLPHSYGFTDFHLIQQGKAWYRLKQVDFDGNFTCSNIVYLQLAGEAFSVSISPNPTSNSFTLFIPPNVNAVQTIICDSKGALVKQQICDGGSTIFNTSNWLPGVYLIRLTTKDGNTTVKKIIVVQ